MSDKKLINFNLIRQEMDLYEELAELKKVEKPKILFLMLMTAELERLKDKKK
jgi:hypothetical protein